MKLIAIILALVSVSPSFSQETSESRIAELERRLNLMREAITSLVNLHTDLRSFVYREVGQIHVRMKPAHLDFLSPSKDLHTLTTDEGLVFYASPIGCEQLDIGVRLRFQIGNPYAATFSRVNANFTHGSKAPVGSINLASMTDNKAIFESPELFAAAHQRDKTEAGAWRKTLKRYSTPLTEPLAAGSWTEITVVIPKSVVLEIAHTEISLTAFAVALNPSE